MSNQKNILIAIFIKIYQIIKRFRTKLWWLPDYSNVSIELSRSLEGDFRSVVINSDYFRTDFLGPTFEIKLVLFKKIKISPETKLL